MTPSLRDRCPEPTAAPFPLDAYRRVLVVAPHPDDETFGCGALIAAARAAGSVVHVLMLTDGAAQGEAAQRRREAEAAAAWHGGALVWAGLSDRGLRFSPELMAPLRAECEAFAPDLVLTPHPDEPHPDHQASALAAWQVLTETLPARADLAWYEVGAPLPHPSHYHALDAAAWQGKRAAMAAFVSQNAHHRYAERLAALNAYRALALGPDVPAAEAFVLLPLRAHGIAAVLPHLQWRWRHAAALAAAPQEAPRVSVLIRTTADPRLEEAVASALAQTHRPLEVVIVGAHGGPLPPPLQPLLQHPAVRYVESATPLPRAAAANALLDAAQGEWLLFLDEDDLIEPNHVVTLLDAALHAQSRAAVARTRVCDADTGALLGEYAFDDIPERLWLANLYPIHAVLFHRSLVTDCGCRFDATLDWSEDWDFWLQVAAHTAFAPTRQASAIYRYRDRAGYRDPHRASDIAAQTARARARAWARLADNERERLLARLAAAWQAQDEERVRVRQQNAALQAHVDALTQQLKASEAARDAAQREAERLAAAWRADLAAIHASLSWRLTAPLRALAAVWRQWRGRA